MRKWFGTPDLRLANAALALDTLYMERAHLSGPFAI